MPGGFFGACVGLEIVIGDQVRACHTWIDSLTIPGGNLNLLPYSIFPELWPYHTWMIAFGVIYIYYHIITIFKIS